MHLEVQSMIKRFSFTANQTANTEQKYRFVKRNPVESVSQIKTRSSFTSSAHLVCSFYFRFMLYKPAQF